MSLILLTAGVTVDGGTCPAGDGGRYGPVALARPG
jgi:hypothetical protein